MSPVSHENSVFMGALIQPAPGEVNPLGAKVLQGKTLEPADAGRRAAAQEGDRSMEIS
jgi:hypothetical protein